MTPAALILLQGPGGAPGTPPAPAAGSGATPAGPLPAGAFRDWVARAARATGLPRRLLEALVATESGGDPTAVSPAGAIGLTQLLPGTAAALGVNPWDPAQNLLGGAEYLRAQLDRFGSLPLALAAYNAGPGAVAAWGEIPPYPETERYVATVLARYRALGGS